MTVYNAEPFEYSKKAISLLISKGYKYQPGSWIEIDRRKIFQDVQILIIRLSRFINNEVLEKFPDLKIIISATTGIDHLNILEIKDRKIKLLCLKDHIEFLKTIPSTAEHAWALLMSLAKKIPEANLNVSKGNWNRDQFRGIQLKNKVIGIVGLGRIGSQVAQYAEAFEMRIIYYDPYVTNSRYEKHNKIEELFTSSDFISIHVHLNDETEFLINRRNIKYLKENAYIINTSRGKIWDEKALVKSLEAGKIRGIATDVLSTELSNIKSSPLWQLKQNYSNIIITPHIGGATYEAMWACEEFLIQFI